MTSSSSAQRATAFGVWILVALVLTLVLWAITPTKREDPYDRLIRNIEQAKHAQRAADAIGAPR